MMESNGNVFTAPQIEQRELEIAYTPPDYSPAMKRQRGEFAFDDPDSSDYVAPGDSPAMLRAVVDKYFDDQVDSLSSTANRLERLKANDPDLEQQPPRSTIAILTAAHDESPISLRETMAQIAKQDGVEQDEILLFGNMPDSLSEQKKVEASTQFKGLVAELSQSYPHLKIRSIVEEYAWSEQSSLSDDGLWNEEGVLMGRLRHDVIDLIALDAARRNFGVDHPVTFLDADTKQMTKTAIEAMALTLKDPEASHVISHLETHYLFDKDTGFNEDGTMSDARKLAILQEIRRRQWLRIGHEGNKRSYAQPYDEEWGAAVALGPLLIAGNYNEKGKWDELNHLKGRLFNARQEITEMVRYAKPAVTARLVFRPRYLKGQRVRSSGRRQEQFLEKWIAGEVDENAYEESTQNYILQGSRYDQFSHTDTVRDISQREHPSFRDEAQLRRIAAAVLIPDTAPVKTKDIPLPDPAPLLARLGLLTADNRSLD